MAVLLCGTNNMQHDEPKDIAEGVIACGSKLLEKDPQLHVVITGILPRDQFPSERRNRIQQTNYMLKSKCWNKGFKYIAPSSQWVSATGELESGLYFKDHLHLIRPGNNILAMQMASIVSVALSESPKIRTPLQHNHDVVTVQALPCLEIIPCTYKHQPPVSPCVLAPHRSSQHTKSCRRTPPLPRTHPLPRTSPMPRASPLPCASPSYIEF